MPTTPRLPFLRRAPNEPEIFEEDQVEDLVGQIEKEIRTQGER
jgi:hypothetical protein